PVSRASRNHPAARHAGIDHLRNRPLSGHYPRCRKEPPASRPRDGQGISLAREGRMNLLKRSASGFFASESLLGHLLRGGIAIVFLVWAIRHQAQPALSLGAAAV